MAFRHRTLLCCCLMLLAGTAVAQQAEPVAGEESELWSQIQQLYDRAKAAGEQVPGSVVEWVRQDLEKIGDWEYRVVPVR